MCVFTRVSGQLSGDPDIALASLQAIDGADVVQTSTRHIVPRWSVGTRHDPGRAQRNGMDLRTRKINSLTERLKYRVSRDYFNNERKVGGVWQHNEEGITFVLFACETFNAF